MGRGTSDRPVVRALTHMPAPGSGRVDMESVREALFVQNVSKDPLGQGGTADVAEADEENGDLLWTFDSFLCLSHGRMKEYPPNQEVNPSRRRVQHRSYEGPSSPSGGFLAQFSLKSGTFNGYRAPRFNGSRACLNWRYTFVEGGVVQGVIPV